MSKRNRLNWDPTDDKGLSYVAKLGDMPIVLRRIDGALGIWTVSGGVLDTQLTHVHGTDEAKQAAEKWVYSLYFEGREVSGGNYIRRKR